MRCSVVAVMVCVGLGASASPAGASYVGYLTDAPYPGSDDLEYSAVDNDLQSDATPGVDNGAANRLTVTSTDGRTVTIRDPGQVIRPASYDVQRTLAHCTFSRDTAVCRVPPGHALTSVGAAL